MVVHNFVGVAAAVVLVPGMSVVALAVVAPALIRQLCSLAHPMG